MMIHEQIENARHWFYNGLGVALFAAVVLLGGCVSDEEYFASIEAANPPEKIMACVSDYTGWPEREIPEFVYTGQSDAKTGRIVPVGAKGLDSTWVHGDEGNEARIKGMTDLQDGVIYLAHRGDTETMAHELAHWLGETREYVAKSAGRRCG